MKGWFWFGGGDLCFLWWSWRRHFHFEVNTDKCTNYEALQVVDVWKEAYAESFTVSSITLFFLLVLFSLLLFFYIYIYIHTTNLYIFFPKVFLENISIFASKFQAFGFKSVIYHKFSWMKESHYIIWTWFLWNYNKKADHFLREDKNKIRKIFYYFLSGF